MSTMRATVVTTTVSETETRGTTSATIMSTADHLREGETNIQEWQI